MLLTFAHCLLLCFYMCFPVCSNGTLSGCTVLLLLGAFISLIIVNGYEVHYRSKQLAKQTNNGSSMTGNDSFFSKLLCWGKIPEK